jgi:hypothetical protein
VRSVQNSGGLVPHPAHILAYQYAILELDMHKMPMRIAAARAAIKERQERIGDAEKYQLEDMLRTLDVLEVQRDRKVG